MPRVRWDTKMPDPKNGGKLLTDMTKAARNILWRAILPEVRRVTPVDTGTLRKSWRGGRKVKKLKGESGEHEVLRTWIGSKLGYGGAQAWEEGPHKGYLERATSAAQRRIPSYVAKQWPEAVAKAFWERRK